MGVRLFVASLLVVAAPGSAQFGDLGGVFGGLGGIGSAGIGNAAGPLGYCVQSKLTGGAGAQGVLGKLTGQPAVTQAPDYKRGLLGQVIGRTGATGTAGTTAPATSGLSLDSLPAGLKTKACNLVLKRAGSFL